MKVVGKTLATIIKEKRDFKNDKDIFLAYGLFGNAMHKPHGWSFDVQNFIAWNTKVWSGKSWATVDEFRVSI